MVKQIEETSSYEVTRSGSTVSNHHSISDAMQHGINEALKNEGTDIVIKGTITIKAKES